MASSTDPQPKQETLSEPWLVATDPPWHTAIPDPTLVALDLMTCKEARGDL